MIKGVPNGGGEIQLVSQFGSYNGEVVLGGFDEDIEEEEDEERRRRDGEKWVLGEEARVVQESVGVGFGARWW